MKILVLSDYKKGLGLAWKLQEEGNDVTVAAKGPSSPDAVCQRIQSWRPMMSKVDMVVCDGNGYGEYEELLNARGKVVLGASKFSDWIGSIKREDFLDECGYEKCEPVPNMLLVHGWFNGRGWLSPYFLSFKEMYLFPGNLGPIVDCMGCVVVPLGDSRLVTEGLMPATSALKQLGLRGMVTAMLHIEDDGSIQCGGVTCGMNYDVIEAMTEGIGDSMTDLLFGVATGIKEEVAVKDDVMIAVKMSVPPWPYVLGRPSLVMGIAGLNEHNLPHVALMDVHRHNGDWTTNMNDGVVLKATAHGQTVKQARGRVYRTLRNIEVPCKQYRMDIGKGVERQIASLYDGGYVGELQYEKNRRNLVARSD